MENAKQTVNELITRATAIGALFGIAVIHAEQVPDGFDDIWYIGLLFIGAVVASLALAAALTQSGDVRLLWVAGGLAALIMIFFVLSRTSGLPGFTDYTGVWDDPRGLASLTVEGLLVCLTAGVLATRSRPVADSGSSSMEPGRTPAPGMS
jgi:hypothetical protein